MDYLYEKRNFLRMLIYGLFLTLVLLVSIRSIQAQDISASADTLTNRNTRKDNISLLMYFHGSLGSYKNVTMGTAYSDSLMVTGTYAGLLHLESGFCFYSFGVTYYFEYVGKMDFGYPDAAGYGQAAGYTLHGTRVFYRISYERFQFLPEGGYVFLQERASIYDQHREKPDLLNKKWEDEGYSYGFSIGHKLIPVVETELWLYGRYVHDNLDIRADHYWLGLHLLGVNTEASKSDRRKPYLQSMYSRFGVGWTMRADGRSEWFLTLALAAAFGLF